jgi:two-component system response regulator
MHSLLLIEDQSDDIALACDAIEEVEDRSKIDIQLAICRNGEEAQIYLLNPKTPLPDVILLDLNMPRLDGHGFLEWIKAQPLLAAIPVVILTTSVHSSDIVRAYKNHCAAYLAKPITYDRFVVLVQRFSLFWFSDVTLPGVPPHDHSNFSD